MGKRKPHFITKDIMMTSFSLVKKGRSLGACAVLALVFCSMPGKGVLNVTIVESDESSDSSSSWGEDEELGTVILGQVSGDHTKFLRELRKKLLDDEIGGTPNVEFEGIRSHRSGNITTENEKISTSEIFDISGFDAFEKAAADSLKEVLVDHDLELVDFKLMVTRRYEAGHDGAYLHTHSTAQSGLFVIWSLNETVALESFPVPPNWYERKTTKGKTYYWDPKTDETRWDRPSTVLGDDKTCWVTKINMVHESIETDMIDTITSDPTTQDNKYWPRDCASEFNVEFPDSEYSADQENFGFTVEKATDEKGTQVNLWIVKDVVEGSWAEKENVCTGDVVVRIDADKLSDREFSHKDDVMKLLKPHRDGSVTSVTFKRENGGDGRLHVLDIHREGRPLGCYTAIFRNTIHGAYPSKEPRAILIGALNVRRLTK